MNKKAIALAIAGVAILGLSGCASDQTEVKTCTVNDKTAAGQKSGVLYLVYTDECGVLTVGDAALKGQWNSSDTYAEIEIGKVYDFELYGFRNGWMSSYQNIIAVTEAEG